MFQHSKSEALRMALCLRTHDRGGHTELPGSVRYAGAGLLERVDRALNGKAAR
jgi:hypothetical protein